MDRKQKIVVGIVVLILIVFGTNNYLSFEKENKKQKLDNISNSNEEKDNYENDTRKQKLIESKIENQNFITENKVFTYSSEFYDVENPDGTVNTKQELTYHTFDFNKKIVTQNSFLNGNRMIMKFPFYEMYKEKGIAATTYVLKVNTQGLKEIWWSPDVPNLGYDYEDGTRIACYDLKVEIKK